MLSCCSYLLVVVPLIGLLFSARVSWWCRIRVHSTGIYSNSFHKKKYKQSHSQLIPTIFRCLTFSVWIRLVKRAIDWKSGVPALLSLTFYYHLCSGSPAARIAQTQSMLSRAKIAMRAATTFLKVFSLHAFQFLLLTIRWYTGKIKMA